MFRVLGRNRIIVLIVLALLNGAAGYGLYQYLIPMREEADQTLSKARSALEQKRAEIQKLKEEYALLQSQLKYFKDLEARGFFNNQNRVAAQEAFEKLRTISGVLKAKYDIKSGTLIEDPRAANADYVILKSPINVELESLDDVDVYSFLKLIQERFPGKVDIVGMDIEKIEDVNPVILRKIGTGNPVAMIKSKIDFEWRTMASRKSLSPDTIDQAEPEAAPSVVSPSAGTTAATQGAAR